MPAAVQYLTRRTKPGRRFSNISAVSCCLFALLVTWAAAEPLSERIDYLYLAVLVATGFCPAIWIVWRFRPRPLTMVTAVSALSLPVLLWLSTRAEAMNRPDSGRVKPQLEILAMYATILPFFWANFRILLLVRIALTRLRPISAGYCANCGYDLRATPHRCPECGLVVKRPGDAA